MKITVIVPTYNRPQALRLSLLSLADQSLLPDEIMIADDGSGRETIETVFEMQMTLREIFPIKHVWQDDIGFRKPKILNEAVRQSSGDYLIFLDGDCMAHKHFVRSHAQYSSPDAILSGKRVEIGKALTESLLEHKIILNSFGPRLVWNAARGGSRKVEEALMVRNAFLRRLSHRDRITDDGVWGCNFSLYKDLFIAINGCDEDFLDGSLEDNDLGIRVLNQGKKIRSVRGLAIVFHLWHPASWSFQSDNYQKSLKIIKRRIENKEPYCKKGIRQL
jgi:glycosyltransferase involved in cell wall biosynthesis